MSNRREFLRTGVALTATVASSAVPGWATERAGSSSPTPSGQQYRRPAGATGDRLWPVKVVFDEGFAESRAFAKAARALGMRTHGISGDVTALWYDDLYHRWRGGPAVIAGLTGASGLFCLERLAWDASHRVVLRVEHTRTPDGRVRHVFAGPAQLSEHAVLRPDRLRAGWPAAMAQLVAGCPSGQYLRQIRSLVATRASSTHWSEPLASWIIAPRAAVSSA